MVEMVALTYVVFKGTSESSVGFSSFSMSEIISTFSFIICTVEEEEMEKFKLLFLSL